MCQHCNPQPTDNREPTATDRAAHFGALLSQPLASEPTAPTVADDTDCEEETEPTVCDDCGNEVDDADKKTSADGDVYCESCYDDKFVVCEDCDKETDKDDCRSADDGSVYCDECYYERYTSCNKCDCEISCDDANSVSHRRYSVLCNDCYNEHYFRCDSCNEECSVDYSYSGPGGDGSYCESCYCNQFSTCDSCNETCNSEDLRECDGEYVCEDCRPTAKRFAPRENSTDRAGSLRTFGVELETSKCPGWRDVIGNHHFRQCADGSIDGEEFVSHVLCGDAGLTAIEEFCEAANDSDFEVDAKCGFHAHFGVGDLSVEQRVNVAYAYKLTYAVWSKFVSKSRRSNSYCGATEWNSDELFNCRSESSFKQFCGSQDRYQWLNLAAYTEHQTFEVRLHSATLDGRKVTNWVVAHLRFIQAVANMSRSDIRAMFEGKSVCVQFAALAKLWDSAELADYYAARALKFGTRMRRESTTESQRTFGAIVGLAPIMPVILDDLADLDVLSESDLPTAPAAALCPL